jgi:hypothetical protein
MSTAWTARYALRTKGTTASAIRELLKITQKPGMTSFAGGLPAPDVFPIQRFEQACHKAAGGFGLAVRSHRRLRALARTDCQQHGTLRDQGEGGERFDHFGLAAGAGPDWQTV